MPVFNAGDKGPDERLNSMARNFKELQARMDPASRANTAERVREELLRMALEEVRSARQLTQCDMADMLGVPQSSISRIEQRADMYLSTLRNYIHAVGGELRIQAVFPDGGTVVIDRFGEYEERPYLVEAIAESGGVFRLRARPLHHDGTPLSTKPVKAAGLTKAMKALHLPEVQIASVRAALETRAARIEIGGIVSSSERVFSIQDLVAAGFDEANIE